MNLARVFPLIIFILVLICGCTTSPNTNQFDVPTTLPTTTQVPVTTPVPPPTLPPTPVSTQVQTPVQASRFTSDDVNNHFMDLAFGGGNIYLERITASSQPVTISIIGGTEEDRTTIENFTAEFNDLSQSVKLFENLKEGTSGQIHIRFLTPDGLAAIDMKSSTGFLNKEFKSGGTTYVKVKDDSIYINSALAGDARKHYILLALLFELGFKGETLKYPDSIFFYQGNTVTDLSPIDIRAAQIMYGFGLFNGMTVDDVKKRVFLKSI